MTETAKDSYGRSLKSAALIGGSSAGNVLLGVVRIKVIAVVLGPAGVGLMGMYGIITSTVGSLAGMGIGSSGTRQIAVAVGSSDRVAIARTTSTLRRMTLVCGALGTLLLAACSAPICRLSFGDSKHVGAILVLSLTVLFSVVSAGQIGLLSGLRRMRDLATVNVLGALIGTSAGVPLVYLFGERGIVPLLFVSSLGVVVTGWWFTRRVPSSAAGMTWREMAGEARALLVLGLAFMGGGFLASAVGYAIRVLVVRRLGVAAAGLYQSSWTLSSLYVGFILGAMATDFFPRLAAVAADRTSIGVRSCHLDNCLWSTANCSRKAISEASRPLKRAIKHWGQVLSFGFR